MSITFFAPGAGDDSRELNLSNRNALDFLEWCGLPMDFGGSVAAAELKVKLSVRIIAGVGDEGLPTRRYANVTDCGREPGYMVERAKSLLEIVTAAITKQGDAAVISWG